MHNINTLRTITKDTTGVSRSRTSKKDRQYNGQKKKNKQWIYKTPHRKLKIEQQSLIGRK